jgi:2-polyprenyl-6-methoxyphenol hydroxylase-like FAD-dependent oxidoreductase
MQHLANERSHSAHMHEVKSVEQTTCCIVGSGPAGAVLALLLARQGIRVTLLEAHMDFDREFRGDTIHPSTLSILDQMGLAERLLQIPHTRLSQLGIQTADGSGMAIFADLTRLRTRYPYIALIPQAKFLEFITAEAQRYPEFRLVMGAQVDELIEEDGKVRGVRYRAHDGWYEVRSVLTVGADGRFSRMRKLAGFEPIKTSPPMDVLWFRLSRKPDDPDRTFGRILSHLIVIHLNRGDYWQLAYVIPKGHYQEVRAAGLEHFRQSIVEVWPELADRMQELQDWKQISVLSVESSRLPRWYRPGLLLIGDAAHVMSPVGGVGINYAIQDAVVAANVLSRKLMYGIVQLQDLATIQRLREWPTRLIQAYQGTLQKNIFASVFSSDQPFTVPLSTKLMLRMPLLRDIPGRIIALGLWPVHLMEWTNEHQSEQSGSPARAN